MGRDVKLLVWLSAGMGVLIVLGTALLGVVILHRMGGQGAARGALRLDAPAGTRLVGVASTGHGLALALSGGGLPDRLVVLDPVTLRPEAVLTIGR